MFSRVFLKEAIFIINKEKPIYGSLDVDFETFLQKYIDFKGDAFWSNRN